MSKFTVNESNRIEKFRETFVSCFKERPKAVYIPLRDDESLKKEQIDGFPRELISGILLVDLPRKVLDEILGIPLDFGRLQLIKVKAKGTSAYILECGYNKIDRIIVFSARL